MEIENSTNWIFRGQIEDARACMSLYRLRKDEFETLHAVKYPNHANKQKRKGGGGNGKKKKNKH